MPEQLVTGVNGVTPIYDPEARWCFWSLPEVWTGGLVNDPISRKYVPKLKDYVVDPDNYVVYIVDHIDTTTLISTLREIRPANMDFNLSNIDILFGVGPGTQADTYRAYIDKSVMPYILAVDNRLKVASTLSSYAKIFKASDLSGTGKVISAVYDNSGNLSTNNVSLEVVALDSHDSGSIKTVSVCHTVEDLQDGEIVTVVIYSDNGHVISKRQLLVENTSFIRSLNSSLKYVTNITLETPFISDTDESIIEFPLNVPINALSLFGIVHYSDGTSLRLPVNGDKFTMLGLEQYLSNIVGQKINLVLSYALSDTEHAYAGVTSDGHYITEPYSLVTTNPNNSYAVKLFCYPEWDSVGNQYTLKWFLFNLDRNIYIDVTPYVVFSTTTGTFNPIGFGLTQSKSVSINLNTVSGSFNNFNHIQVVNISLYGAPNLNGTSWTVSQESTNSTPYGLDVYATKASSSQINIAFGLTDYNEWLNKIYLETYPLINRLLENDPPTPTHFIVHNGVHATEFPISQWNTNLTITGTINIYSNVYIRFIKRIGLTDLELSISGLLIKS